MGTHGVRIDLISAIPGRCGCITSCRRRMRAWHARSSTSHFAAGTLAASVHRSSAPSLACHRSHTRAASAQIYSATTVGSCAQMVTLTRGGADANRRSSSIVELPSVRCIQSRESTGGGAPSALSSCAPVRQRLTSCDQTADGSTSWPSFSAARTDRPPPAPPPPPPRPSPGWKRRVQT